jgi:hypothetical protein
VITRKSLRFVGRDVYQRKRAWLQWSRQPGCRLRAHKGHQDQREGPIDHRDGEATEGSAGARNGRYDTQKERRSGARQRYDACIPRSAHTAFRHPGRLLGRSDMEGFFFPAIQTFVVHFDGAAMISADDEFALYRSYPAIDLLIIQNRVSDETQSGLRKQHACGAKRMVE